jgi:hypothetical protein
MPSTGVCAVRLRAHRLLELGLLLYELAVLCADFLCLGSELRSFLQMLCQM